MQFFCIFMHPAPNCIFMMRYPQKKNSSAAGWHFQDKKWINFHFILNNIMCRPCNPPAETTQKSTAGCRLASELCPPGIRRASRSGCPQDKTPLLINLHPLVDFKMIRFFGNFTRTHNTHCSFNFQHNHILKRLKHMFDVTISSQPHMVSNKKAPVM